MTHQTEQQGFPAQPLRAGMTIRLRALSPTLDSEVAGVTCTQWAIYGRDLSAGLEELQDVLPPFTLEEAP